MTLNKNITSAYTNENLKLGKNKGTDSLYYTPLVALYSVMPLLQVSRYLVSSPRCVIPRWSCLFRPDASLPCSQTPAAGSSAVCRYVNLSYAHTRLDLIVFI